MPPENSCDYYQVIFNPSIQKAIFCTCTLHTCHIYKVVLATLETKSWKKFIFQDFPSYQYSQCYNFLTYRSTPNNFVAHCLLVSFFALVGSFKTHTKLMPLENPLFSIAN